MTTYAHILEVSKSSKGTHSQKVHELFKDAKGQDAKERIIFDISENEVKHLPEIPQGSEVVFIDAGQVYFIRYPDNTYHVLDTGVYSSGNKFYVASFDKDYDQEDMESFWDLFLNIEDTPMAFYHGAFVDQEAEQKFLASFPEV